MVRSTRSRCPKSPRRAHGHRHRLHEIPYGEVWPQDLIAARKAEIAAAGFDWVVVESLPIHERIKRGEGDLSALVRQLPQSMANLAAEGVLTICYNFMPLLDWTRTDLAAPVARGGTCLRFEAHRMAAFESTCWAGRPPRPTTAGGAREGGGIWFQQASEADRDTLLHSIMSGLPGAFDRYDIAGLRTALQGYDGITRDTIPRELPALPSGGHPRRRGPGHAALRPSRRPAARHSRPAAHRLGRRRHRMGDGGRAESAGQRPDALLRQPWGEPRERRARHRRALRRRIHFAHLRNVRKDPDGSFEEAAHLDGDTDMVALCAVLAGEEARRRAEGRADHAIPFRPDHGHELLSDIGAGTHPGYPLIGRLRGLAELRGVFRAVARG
jgi:mannonate dehydratase